MDKTTHIPCDTASAARLLADAAAVLASSPDGLTLASLQAVIGIMQSAQEELHIPRIESTTDEEEAAEEVAFQRLDDLGMWDHENDCACR